MMKHYNIPIFLPELACPYRCVYCNQFHITGNSDIVKPEDVKNIIDSHLASFKEEKVSKLIHSFQAVENILTS